MQKTIKSCILIFVIICRQEEETGLSPIRNRESSRFEFSLRMVKRLLKITEKSDSNNYLDKSRNLGPD